jgi:penicillin amidase
VLAWGLSVNWETELVRALLLDALGAEKAADLTPQYHDDYQTILPDTKVGRRLATELLDAYHHALTSMPLGKIPDGNGIGSNNWVVNGQNSASGRPILANDPHLPAVFPAFWYENHLVGGGFNVTGFTMPAVPGVIIGHNENVAWGVTNAFPDVQDIYVERFHAQDPALYDVNGRWVKADLMEEAIRVRGRKTVVETVRYTRHGPVFSDLLPQQGRDLALRWASYDRNNHMRAVLDINRASDGKQFRESMRHWGFPSQNVVYADVQGNIGYKMPGLVPRRRKGSGLVPVPGWRDDYEWEGWIPFDELPEQCNPPEGIIVTANNRVHGSTYPYLLTGEWLPDYRAKRIKALISEYAPLTLEMNGRIQADTLSLQARRFLNLALPRLNQDEDSCQNLAYLVQMLRNWDGDMRADRIAPTLYWGWLVHFTQYVIEQATGPALASELLRKSPPEGFPLDPFLESATELALNWLERGSPDWVGDITSLLLPSFEKTVEVLKQELGSNQDRWQWGNLHRIELRHPLARLPGLGRSWKPLTIPAGGDGYTVNQSEASLVFPPDPVGIIASCRLLIDVGEWDNSLAALPGGQSGHPASPHYQDGLADWRNNRYHPLLFSRKRIEAATESISILQPMPGSNPVMKRLDKA